jgi:hypothetical protein
MLRRRQRIAIEAQQEAPSEKELRRDSIRFLVKISGAAV